MNAILQMLKKRVDLLQPPVSSDSRSLYIDIILDILYEKGVEVNEHSMRIYEYCKAISRNLGLNTSEIDELTVFALLHDIGKLGIDLSILNKSAPLTPAEWAQMKRHPEIGYRFANSIPELASVAENILLHHEHWDGKGYPYGLKGEEIPLACRILAVADSFDAMTSDRIYRDAMSKTQAILELGEGAGKQFDPDIIDLFINLLESGRI